MDIFVLWNLFQRKKKTLRDTVQIITDKKAKDITHVLLHLQHACRQFGGRSIIRWVLSHRPRPQQLSIWFGLENPHASSYK